MEKDRPIELNAIWQLYTIDAIKSRLLKVTDAVGVNKQLEGECKGDGFESMRTRNGNGAIISGCEVAISI